MRHLAWDMGWRELCFGMTSELLSRPSFDPMLSFTSSCWLFSSHLTVLDLKTSWTAGYIVIGTTVVSTLATAFLL